jgi:hypothetical protein
MVAFDNRCVVFKSDKEFFDKEESGKKPNTIRLLRSVDFLRLKACYYITIYQNHDTHLYFDRKITDISKIGTLAGKELVVISWGQPNEV